MGAAGVDGVVDAGDLGFVNVVGASVKRGYGDGPAAVRDEQPVGLAQLVDGQLGVLDIQAFLPRPGEYLALRGAVQNTDARVGGDEAVAILCDDRRIRAFEREAVGGIGHRVIDAAPPAFAVHRLIDRVAQGLRAVEQPRRAGGDIAGIPSVEGSQGNRCGIVQRAASVQEHPHAGRAVVRFADAGVRVHAARHEDAQQGSRLRVVVLRDDFVDCRDERLMIRLGHVHQPRRIRQPLEMVLQGNRVAVPHRGRLEHAVAAQHAQVEGRYATVIRVDDAHQVLAEILR